MGKQFLQVKAVQLVTGGICPEVVIRALEGKGHGWKERRGSRLVERTISSNGTGVKPFGQIHHPGC
jgi:hypothetical protein